MCECKAAIANCRGNCEINCRLDGPLVDLEKMACQLVRVWLGRGWTYRLSV